MKTILIATDFSANAKHAAAYGYRLAAQIRANIILCNAVIVPAEAPQAGLIAWPMDEVDHLLDESTAGLKKLKAYLEQHQHNSDFSPVIKFVNEPGTVTDVVKHITGTEQVDLVIIATHGSDGLSTFLLGDHSRTMINSTTTQLLLVPALAAVNPIKKIAFAADFKGLEENLTAIYSLIPLARLLNAEILVTHVYHEEAHSEAFVTWMRDFLTELSNRANYRNIYYRIIKNDNTEDGLDWLCQNGQVDILAMPHGKHDFIDRILNGSHTQKMAARIQIPLLVIPAKANN